MASLEFRIHTSKIDKVKEGGSQRKPMTFCELTDFKHFEKFWKSRVENHAL